MQRCLGDARRRIYGLRGGSELRGGSGQRGRAREVYAFVSDAEVMGKDSHVPLGRWQGPWDDGQ